MSPIRIGFIGLSASGSWASIAHIQHLRVSPDYKIVALANSSLESARAAIQAYSLPASTKAYASAEDIAKDPDVDLVVCSVNVAKHYALIKPALEHGKMAFVEWPLGRTLQEAEELTKLAKEKGVRTIVGLQGRKSTLIAKVKQLVDEGRVGRILSSTLVAVNGNSGGQVPQKWRIFIDKNGGATNLTIHFAHFVDSVTRVLGEIASLNSVLGNQRPIVDIIDDDGKVVESGVKKDAPDHILVQGTLVSGAVISISMRGGKGFTGFPGLVWRIYGEKGEILVTGTGPSFGTGVKDASVKVYDNEKDTVDEIELAEDSEDLPLPARYVARLYDAFANGGEYPTFEDALERHRLIDKVNRSSEDGKIY